MRKLLTITLLAILLAMPTTASAQQLCAPTAIRQHDLAGFYVSDTMQLSIYPCGGSYMQWTNLYGNVVEASYVTVKHVPDGVVATGVYSSNGFMDGSTAIGYKAAEPGFIEVITVGPLGDRVYRARKLY
jgi:hypothetical protein